MLLTKRHQWSCRAQLSRPALQGAANRDYGKRFYGSIELDHSTVAPLRLIEGALGVQVVINGAALRISPSTNLELRAAVFAPRCLCIICRFNSFEEDMIAIRKSPTLLLLMLGLFVVAPRLAQAEATLAQRRSSEGDHRRRPQVGGEQGARPISQPARDADLLRHQAGHDGGRDLPGPGLVHGSPRALSQGQRHVVCRRAPGRSILCGGSGVAQGLRSESEGRAGAIRRSKTDEADQGRRHRATGVGRPRRHLPQRA